MKSNFYLPTELSELGLGSVGKGVLLSRKVSIYSPEKIFIGTNVRIDDFCILSGRIILGDYIHISAYTGIFAGDSGVKVESFSTISGRCLIYGKSDDYSGKFMTNPMVPKEFTNVDDSLVHIEKHVILGCGCTVLPGVRISEGTAVGAMSLIRENTCAWSVYVGVPAVYSHPRERRILDLVKEIKGEV